MSTEDVSDDTLDNAARAMERTVRDLVAAIEDCLNADRWEPCLILLFVAIDSMAWLERDGEGDVQRKDFVAWAERYMLPESGLQCTADELYSARCGMLHSLTADSRRQRANRDEIRKVYFFRRRADDEQSVDALLSIRFAEPRLPVYVNVDHLVHSLKSALGRFSAALNDDEAKWRLVASRVNKSYLGRGTLR
jgi:hypothetical protein